MLLKYALANLFRRKQRTLLTAGVVGLGVFIGCLFAGGKKDIYHRLIGTSSKIAFGNIVISAPGFLDFPSLPKRVNNYDTLVKNIARIMPEALIIPRSLGTGMVVSSRSSSGVSFLAIDPKLDSSKTNIYLESLTEGDPLDQNDESGALVGAAMAKKLDFQVGSKFVFNASDIQSAPISNLLRVRGIFDTGNPELDAHAIILTQKALQSLLGMSEKDTSFLAIFFPNSSMIEPAVKDLKHLVKREKLDLNVAAWYDSQTQIRNFLALDKLQYLVVAILLGLVIASGIFNTTIMNVSERKRELATILALGCKPKLIFAAICLESLFIACLGFLIGGAVTLPAYVYLNTFGFDATFLIPNGINSGGVVIEPIVRCLLDIETLLAIFGTVGVMTLAAALIPGLLAAMTVPVKHLRDY